jgi:hypothetical protein
MNERFATVEIYFLDLGEQLLPYCEDDEPPVQASWSTMWAELSAELSHCDAFVIVVPEWGGMAPPTLKNLFLLCNRQEMSHKPALIVGVSRGKSGNYPISELRMSSYKNTQICYIPENIIVRDVETRFNTSSPACEEEALIRHRMCYALAVLTEYARALSAVRASGVIDPVTYRWGV